MPKGIRVWSFILETRENLEAETDSRNSVIVVTTAPGEEIEDEVVEMYFENKKKSGGGAIKSWVRMDRQMIITFHDKEGIIVFGLQRIIQESVSGTLQNKSALVLAKETG